MEKILKRFGNWFLLLAYLPILCGCEGAGGGGINSLGSLFGSTVGSNGAGGVVPGSADILVTTTAIIGDPGSTVNVISNPEPTTIALLGSGILLMSYLQNRKNRV